MSGGSGTNNSWTILTPEETVAETLKPLGEEAGHHAESLTSGAVDPGPGDNPPANSEESAEGAPVEGQLVPEEETAELSGDTSAERHTPVPAAVTDAAVPTTLEGSGSSGPDNDALSRSEGLPEGPAQSSPDPDSFSDSYTHITPSPEEPPASLLSTETLGGGEFTEEEENLTQRETGYPLNGEEQQHEGEESDLLSRTPDLGKQADSHVDSEVAEDQTEKLGEEGDPEVRRRRSLLAALERIGRKEEDEEEEFQLPQREEDSVFSLNKCILGAVILLGLGTIFISGVFMDLDEDSDYATRELQDAEIPGKQEWLNPEAPPTPVDADSTELLNKLATGNQQISELQAQLQAQEDELKVAKEAAAAEGAKERLHWEEVEKENSRLKREMASVPVLQKENERMKRELESVVALQKELETLRSTVTELKVSQARETSTPPPSGQPLDSTQSTEGSTEKLHKKSWDHQREKKKDMKKDEKYKTQKEKFGKKEGGRKDGDKTEWKKGKHEHKSFSEETKQWKEKDWKKDKARRGDEGKSWKDREGKKEWKDKSGRKEWKEEKDWKKGKHEKVNEGKQWKGKEEKRDWEVGRDHREKYKGKEWKGEKEWKKGKESGKERWEKKGWNEKGEKKEWKKDSDLKSGGSKKGERKQWEESRTYGKERKDEKKQWNEKELKGRNGKDDKALKNERKQWEKKEEKWKQKEKKESKNHNFNHGDEEEHLWGDRKPPHSHRKPSLDQPEYWAQQRARLQHYPKPPQHCNTPESCAQMEGLLPVPFPEFEAILQTYLAKAEGAGVDQSKREELKKLTSEFFKEEVFVHDQMSFQEFVEDVGDILEDMVEGDEDEDGEDSALEDEMEGFEREVMKKFSAPEKEERSKGEMRKESVRGHG
ncbi:pre-B-cell leukemia homeobox interacting protein 1b isoform X2 [Halichoeres trimaculatus]|uniref:pre-B-cell leukemia homeobox interacting protein 1b isoform X2 n=1 Tax=Halichoeres trimaculatus TaxID=147232 RepID=UPI003D9F3238